MVRPIARKKLRNPKLKVTRKKAEKVRKIKFKGHPFLHSEWDRNKTVLENYKKFGLVSKVNGARGGTEKNLFSKPTENESESAAEPTEQDIKKAIPKGYGIIERDEAGNVINIVLPEEEDPLDSDYEVEKVEAKGKAAKMLEEFAETHEERRERWLSQGSRRILQSFIDKHGDNYEAMFWDSKLNKQQLTKHQIEKKIKQYLVEKEKANF
ncbi:Nucleolar protein 16 [Coemansia sp. RSA 2599]|nr:Nucleolar protein 16 [Coemansia sp. RSA 2598]KAJ1826194.1 Nucleolar protein 16 [Coemansia sp. RSA 2599]